MSGRAVAATMPLGAWVAGTESGRGDETVCSAVVPRPPLSAVGAGRRGRRFLGPPRRGRRRVTLAAFLLFALTLVAGKDKKGFLGTFFTTFVTRHRLTNVHISDFLVVDFVRVRTLCLYP